MVDQALPRVLLVDDDPDVGRLVQHILHSSGFEPALHVTTGREALSALEGIDIVLLDQQLPDTSGLDVLDAIRARPAPPGVILITGHGNESLAAAALRRGADDYLAKDAALTDLLPQIVERVRRARELRKALAAAEQDLVRAERLAAIGEMTVTLHHEINNPLMAAFAEVELLLLRSDATPEQRTALEEIQSALRRIRDIVQRIGELRQARKKDYPGGVQMLDLERGVERQAPSVLRGTALVHVADEDLARVVSLLLRGAGFQVERCRDILACQAAADRLGVSVVLISGGASSPGAHPLEGFVAKAGRDYLLVALVGGEPAAALAAGADHVVQVPFDPGTFTDEILHRLSPSSPADRPSPPAG